MPFSRSRLFFLTYGPGVSQRLTSSGTRVSGLSSCRIGSGALTSPQKCFWIISSVSTSSLNVWIENLWISAVSEGNLLFPTLCHVLRGSINGHPGHICPDLLVCTPYSSVSQSPGHTVQAGSQQFGVSVQSCTLQHLYSGTRCACPPGDIHTVPVLSGEIPVHLMSC